MSVLKTLKLSAAVPAAIVNDPLSRARGRLLEQLAEQREFATATLEGRIYEPPKRLAMRKNVDGERIQTEVNRRVRKNFYQDQAGAYQFVMRIGLGAKPLELQPGKPAINGGASRGTRPHAEGRTGCAGRDDVQATQQGGVTRQNEARMSDSGSPDAAFPSCGRNCRPPEH
jgi:hypothetical protein